MAPAARRRRGDEGILRGTPIGERERSGGGGDGIARVDIVLEQNRDAVQRTAHVAVLAFLIELAGDGGGIGIDGQHGAELRTVGVTLAGALTVNGLDPVQIKLRKAR